MFTVTFRCSYQLSLHALWSNVSLCRRCAGFQVRYTYLALTQGLVCMLRLSPQLPCFSEASGKNPLSGANSSAIARI